MGFGGCGLGGSVVVAAVLVALSGGLVPVAGGLMILDGGLLTELPPLCWFG